MLTRCLLLACLVSLLSVGCAPVRFNQKQRLSYPSMMFDGDALGADIAGHILSPREVAIGGFSAGGAGGCGCN